MVLKPAIVGWFETEHVVERFSFRVVNFFALLIFVDDTVVVFSSEA